MIHVCRIDTLGEIGGKWIFSQFFSSFGMSTNGFGEIEPSIEEFNSILGEVDTAKINITCLFENFTYLLITVSSFTIKMLF